MYENIYNTIINRIEKVEDRLHKLELTVFKALGIASTLSAIISFFLSRVL